METPVNPVTFKYTNVEVYYTGTGQPWDTKPWKVAYYKENYYSGLHFSGGHEVKAFANKDAAEEYAATLRKQA